MAINDNGLYKLNKFQIVILPNQTSIDKKNNKMKVHVVNTTKNNIELISQDGSVIMIQEAKDRNGEWKPIEFWQYSYCGNSYFSLDLKPGYYVNIEAPQYIGDYDL